MREKRRRLSHKYPQMYMCIASSTCVMKVDIEPKEVVERTADDRGRVTLGSDYADENVTLLIVSDE